MSQPTAPMQLYRLFEIEPSQSRNECDRPPLYVGLSLSCQGL
ncbi:hypothetical protein QUA54_33965 [Microcoleus sp. MOSTC5]